MNTKAKTPGTTETTGTTQNSVLSNLHIRSRSQGVLRRMVRSLIRPASSRVRRRATDTERNLVLTGLIVGFLSIFAAVFPLCGIPLAIVGLLSGLYGRRATPLYVMSSWAIALSFFGLLIGLIYGAFTISIYVSRYVLGA